MDFEESLRLAKMGIQEMQIYVACAYRHGYDGQKRDLKKALFWFKQAGDTESLEKAKEIENILKNDDRKVINTADNAKISVEISED
jgi:hypothetical protein